MDTFKVLDLLPQTPTCDGEGRNPPPPPPIMSKVIYIYIYNITLTTCAKARFVTLSRLNVMAWLEGGGG